MRLKELRSRTGMSADHVAHVIGVDRVTIYKWEAGTTEPKASQIKMLANLFNVTTDYLLGR